MADAAVPKFLNDIGVEVIEIGAREFECMGATPPHDHPHVYLDMGNESEIICPYCSTVFRFDPGLSSDQSRPPEAVFRDIRPVRDASIT